ncbi:hypothetical protein HDU96_007068 [Phlyctochytrium bullatum]|nr:hypothetical protein HDU96_007068 [Phlyctochytrium bullatum]
MPSRRSGAKGKVALVASLLLSSMAPSALAARIFVVNQIQRIGEQLSMALVVDRNEFPENQTIITSFNLTADTPPPPSLTLSTVGGPAPSPIPTFPIVACGRERNDIRYNQRCLPDSIPTCMVTFCNYTVPYELYPSPYSVRVQFSIVCAPGALNCVNRDLSVATTIILTPGIATAPPPRPTSAVSATVLSSPPSRTQSQSQSAKSTTTKSAEPAPAVTAAAAAQGFAAVSSNPMYMGLFVAAVAAAAVFVVVSFNYFRKRYQRRSSYKAGGDMDIAKRLRMADVTGCMTAAPPAPPGHDRGLEPGSELRRASISNSIHSVVRPNRRNSFSSKYPNDDVRSAAYHSIASRINRQGSITAERPGTGRLIHFDSIESLGAASSAASNDPLVMGDHGAQRNPSVTGFDFGTAATAGGAVYYPTLGSASTFSFPGSLHGTTPGLSPEELANYPPPPTALTSTSPPNQAFSLSRFSVASSIGGVHVAPGSPTQTALGSAVSGSDVSGHAEPVVQQHTLSRSLSTEYWTVGHHGSPTGYYNPSTVIGATSNGYPATSFDYMAYMNSPYAAYGYPYTGVNPASLQLWQASGSFPPSGVASDVAVSHAHLISEQMVQSPTVAHQHSTSPELPMVPGRSFASMSATNGTSSEAPFATAAAGPSLPKIESGNGFGNIFDSEMSVLASRRAGPYEGASDEARAKANLARRS